MKKLSLLNPCCNEQEMLPVFYREITRVLKEMNKDDEEKI